MPSVRRKVYVVLCFLSLLVILCMWYCQSRVTCLSIVTTVHNKYIYTAAGELAGTAESNSDIKDDLSELRHLKTNPETLIEKYSGIKIDNNTSNGSSQLSSATEDNPRIIKSDPKSILESDMEMVNTSQTRQELTTAAVESSWTYNEDSTDFNLTTTSEVEGVNSHLTSIDDNGKDHDQPRSSKDSQIKKSDVDLLVESLLLQALMNETSDKQPRVQSLEPRAQFVEVATKPGCKNTGKFPSQESSDVWLNFKNTLEMYADFHRQQLKQLKSGNRSIRTLTWSCHDPVKCAGIGDQLFRIQEALIFAIAFKRVLSLHWNPAGYETMKYLQPNKIDWTYFNKSLGMHEFHDKEISKIKIMDTAQKFEPLYNLLAGENRTHVTVNYELMVPFLRGMSHALRANSGIREALKESGFPTLLLDKKKRLPVNFLSGELLRYLFDFNGFIVDKVDQVQNQLGIEDKAYLAVHIRTGFLGMKQEESGKFSSEKIYRNPDDWEKTLACSVSLADKLFGSETPLFLATDSSKVKALAAEKYSKRFVMINVTLQHVAFSNNDAHQRKSDASIAVKRKYLHTTASSKDTTNSTLSLSEKSEPFLIVDGVDGFMATWIEFLLLARASAMVHSISGFSSTASQYCSMHNQYHVPNCGR